MSKLRYILVVALLLVSISLVVTGCVGNSTSFTSRYLCVDEKTGPQLSNQELGAEVAPVLISVVVETVGYNWFWRTSLNSSPLQMS
jgi:hypothetical protein